MPVSLPPLLKSGKVVDAMPSIHRLTIENVTLDDEREIDTFDQQVD
jgi:hypothetical protein